MTPLKSETLRLYVQSTFEAFDAFLADAEMKGFLQFPKHDVWEETMPAGISRAQVRSWYRQRCQRRGLPCLVLHDDRFVLWLYGPNVGLMRTMFFDPWLVQSDGSMRLYHEPSINRARTIMVWNHNMAVKRNTLLRPILAKHNRHLFLPPKPEGSP